VQRLHEAAQGPRSVASVQAANKRDELAGQEFAQVRHLALELRRPLAHSR